MATHARLASLLLLGVMAILAVLIATIYESDKRYPQVGTDWTLELDDLTLEEEQPLHLIVYDADCRWCRRQLEEIDSAKITQSGSPIVLVNIGDRGAVRAQVHEMGLDVRIVDSSRATLEKHIGPVGTPTHILLDQHRTVAGFHRGYLNGSQTQDLRSHLSSVVLLPTGSP